MVKTVKMVKMGKREGKDEEEIRKRRGKKEENVD
jgi:hypothetical protein